jgi:hypothetical protein
LYAGFEHVRHAQHIHARRERRVLIDQRAEDVREVNDVRDVGMVVEHAHDVAEVAHVHGRDGEITFVASSLVVQVGDNL